MEDYDLVPDIIKIKDNLLDDFENKTLFNGGRVSIQLDFMLRSIRFINIQIIF